MKQVVVIIGSLCREHIISEKLKQYNLIVISNFLNNKIYENCFEYIIDTPLSNENIIKNILELQKEYEIDFVVMNQEKFIAQGLVDELDRINVKSVAPFKNVAKIESDKHYARKLLNDNGLSHFNPDYKYFDSYNEEEIINYINKLNNYYVVKDTSLKGGKGVKVSSVHLKNIDEGLQFCKSIIEENDSFLIEEKLVGAEFSLHSFTDSKSVKHTFPIKDFKRLDDNNVGSNTGSMGCISGNLNFLDKNDIMMAQKINESVLLLLKQTGKFKGILYGSFIKTIDNKLKIIEFNSRLGDPETIPLLTLLKTDLYDIFKAIVDENLKDINIDFEDKYTLTRYIVPPSYCRPDIEFKQNEIIIPNLENIYYGDIINKQGRLFTNKSRSLCIITTNNNLEDLYTLNQSAIRKLICIDLHFRDDIGKNLTYKTSGVDIENYENSLDNVIDKIKSTHNKNILKDDYCSFSGILDIGNDKVLLQSIDGIGTKSLLYMKYKTEQNLLNMGSDIFHANLNDIICCCPNINNITFMDYYGTNKIDKRTYELILSGIIEECKKYNATLIGGETAEMRVYKDDCNVELVGAITGICNKKDLINLKNVKQGNIILGIKTDNLATNGFSLVRKVLDTCDDDEIELYIDQILGCHKSYYNHLKKLYENDIFINSVAHITGGGIYGNLKRVIPNNLNFKIDENKILENLPECMNFIKTKGNLTNKEMFSTFNMSIGFIIIVDVSSVADIFELLGNEIIEIGYIY